MVILALKNLLYDKGKFLLSVLGIALAITLVLILQAFGEGIRRQSVAYINNSGADLFVMQKGVENLQSARSVVPLAAVRKVEGVRGVAKVSPVYAAPLQFQHQGHKTPVYLIGYDSPRGLGGPWLIDRGTKPTKSGDAVFDLSLAARQGVALGERVSILGRRFKVVGFSRETASFMNPFIFMTGKDAAALLSARGSASYLLVKKKPGVSLFDLKRRIEAAVGDLRVATTAGLAANDRKLMDDIMARPINVMLGIAYVVGTLVIGLTVYVDTVDRLREYGVLKAIGAGNPYLYGQVLQQSLVGAFFGFVAGAAVASGATRAIEYLFPRFELTLLTGAVVTTGLLALLMGAVAAVIPIARISSVDPVDVFKR